MTAKPRKRMRLPNGFGQISEIKNRKLRKPFRAMVTIGTAENGRPICRPIKPTAYFKTYNEAYAALVAYNENPYEEKPSMTMKELFDIWFEEYSNGKAYSTINTAKNAWNWCKELWDIPVSDIRIRHIKGCIDNTKASPNVASRMKQILNMVLDYGLIYELTDKNYARMYIAKNITAETDPASPDRPHISYTDAEMEILWKSEGMCPEIDIILVQAYSGWRPSELFELEIENIDLDGMTFKGGIKTKAGKNRIVPIHSKIEPIVRRYVEQSTKADYKYLFTSKTGRKIQYSYFRTNYNNVIKQLKLNPKHRPHDGRVRFVTACKKYEVNDYAIKYMVGHKIMDITEDTYTKRDISWLKNEIEKIK